MKNAANKTRTPPEPGPGQPEEERSKFIVYGREVLGRRVHKSGGSGRVYLPRDWLGKKVKVIRVD